ncbi:MAG: type II toxin-antitoxin system VapC family toxin [Spirochaetes bacterium]|nr:MAG: type II toxin-antitoxin system VapC family toxin [Spirochaetota bacterium]
MNLVDSSGWLEYFADGKNADFFAAPIEDMKNCIISSINVYEVFKKLLEERDEQTALQIIAVMHQCRIEPVDARLALLGAQISRDRKLPMADSLILATARQHNAILWTQDTHFKGIEGVRYIGK